MRTRLSLLLLLSSTAILLGACSSHPAPSTNAAPDSANANASLSNAVSPEAVQQASKTAKVASLPQPDWNTPDSAYVPITKGTQLMYLYAAFSGMPPDYDKMASAISQDYNMTSDQFKKHDMVAALKPKIDAGIADAKAHPYIVITDDPQLGHYDFQRKAFPVGSALFQSGGYEQIVDTGGPVIHLVGGERLSVSNGQPFQQINVPDENLAKTIEAQVSQYGNFKERIYAFVQGTDDSAGPMVNTEITKVELLDPRGQVLLQQAAAH